MRQDQDDQPTFEQALERLEGIVRDLEDGQVGLEDSLARYEKGVALLKHCYSILQTAERRIALLTGVDDQGNPMTETFDAEATHANANAPAETDNDAGRLF